MKSALTPMFRLGLFTCFLLGSVSTDLQETKTKPGEDVTLQCQGPKDATNIMFRWIRPDLKSDGYVYAFKDGHINENSQLESFRGRVELKDPQMKNGEFSVVLKNVNIYDTGTYECHVGYGGKPQLISTMDLTVEPGHKEKQEGNEEKPKGDQEGEDTETNSGRTAGLVIVGVVVVVAAIIGFVIYKKHKGSNENSLHQQDPDEQVNLQHLQNY